MSYQLLSNSLPGWVKVRIHITHLTLTFTWPSPDLKSLFKILCIDGDGIADCIYLLLYPLLTLKMSLCLWCNCGSMSLGVKTFVKTFRIAKIGMIGMEWSFIPEVISLPLLPRLTLACVCLWDAVQTQGCLGSLHSRRPRGWRWQSGFQDYKQMIKFVVTNNWNIYPDLQSNTTRL